MNLLHNPNDYYCGPTCLKMVADYFGVGKEITIEDLAVTCGTTEADGTDDRQMRYGLQTLGIHYIVRRGSTVGLIDILSYGAICILRTLDAGEKHWIIAYGLEDFRFRIADPDAGDIRLTEKEIEELWAPRDYFMFDLTPL